MLAKMGKRQLDPRLDRAVGLVQIGRRNFTVGEFAKNKLIQTNAVCERFRKGTFSALVIP
jgi:hypothetical protein